MREDLRDRARGALVGLAVGDALGTTLEFQPRPPQPVLTTIVGGGPFRLEAGQWTDDTAMALALADSLLADPDLDERDLMGRFCDWWRNGRYSCTGTCFDIGITTSEALSRFERTGNPISGSEHPRSAGNGSLMRLSPVAVRHWSDADRLADVAARQSRTTHAADEAVQACVAYARLIAHAIAGDDPLATLATDAEHRLPVLAKAMGTMRLPRDAVRASGYVVDSLGAALWAVAGAVDFRDAALRAANLGDDADTVAAITGQLAGAIWGYGSIPSDWLACLAWHERLVRTADALFDAAEARDTRGM